MKKIGVGGVLKIQLGSGDFGSSSNGATSEGEGITANDPITQLFVTHSVDNSTEPTTIIPNHNRNSSNSNKVHAAASNNTNTTSTSNTNNTSQINNNNQQQQPTSNEILSGGTQGIQHHIQKTWSSYGMMSDAQRATLLKGLIERCSSKEIDYICSLLNFKLAESSQVPVYMPSGMQSNKTFAIGTAAIKKNYMPGANNTSNNNNPKTTHQPNNNNNNTSTKGINKNRKIINSNMYAKLIDNHYDTSVLMTQYRNSRTEELLEALEFLSRRCNIFHSSLALVKNVWERPDPSRVLESLFQGLAKVLNVKYISVYEFNEEGSNYELIASTWDESASNGRRARKFLREVDIAHAGMIRETREQCVSFSFRRTEDYTEEIEKRYPKDIDCIISIPIASKPHQAQLESHAKSSTNLLSSRLNNNAASTTNNIHHMSQNLARIPSHHNLSTNNLHQQQSQGNLLTSPTRYAILEVMNRTIASQFFGDEEEFVLQSCVSIIGLLLEYVSLGKLVSELEEDLSNLMKLDQIIGKSELMIPNASLELNDQLSTFLPTLQKLLRAERCHYYTVDWSKQELVPIYTNSISNNTVVSKFNHPINSSLLGMTVTKNQLINLNNNASTTSTTSTTSTSNNNNNNFNAQYDKKMNFNTRNMLAVPVSFEGKVVGVLEFLNKTIKLQVFRARDEEYLIEHSKIISGFIFKREQKKRLEVLSTTLSQWSNLWDWYRRTTPNLLIGLDPNGKMVSLNRAAEEIFLGHVSDSFLKLMQNSSYIMWLGEHNPALTNDIRRCLTGAKDPVYRTSSYSVNLENGVRTLPCNGYCVFTVPEKVRPVQNCFAFLCLQPLCGGGGGNGSNGATAIGANDYTSGESVLVGDEDTTNNYGENENGEDGSLAMLKDFDPNEASNVSLTRREESAPTISIVDDTNDSSAAVNSNSNSLIMTKSEVALLTSGL